MTLQFDHDPAKARSNLRKHGVSFAEAASTFLDENALSWIDEGHSKAGDERFIHIGISSRERLLFVVHNESDGMIRIITARVASRSQREVYEEG